MQDILGESLKKLKRKRVRKTRMIAILLVLSLLVSLDVFWSLRQPGLTLVGDADCKITEHTHSESCQNGKTTCKLIEHIHTIECYSDKTADVESQLDWQKMFEGYPYTGNLAEDLVGIAKTQVGYTESSLNFEVDTNGTRHGYTRYGAWYGTPYNSWSATFVAFCLNYAKADVNEYPINTGANSMVELWKKEGKFAVVGKYKPLRGDLVFFKDNTVGIVCETLSSTCYIIRGDVEDTVKSSLISYPDENILGWGIVNKRIPDEELYDISNGPAVFILANETANTGVQTYMLRNTGNVKDLIEFLNENNGDFYFTLLDTSNRELPKDENGNYIVHAGTQYKITLTISRADGFPPGTYDYRFPSGVEIDAGLGTGEFNINGKPIGSWKVTTDGLLSLTFNAEANKLSDVTVSATMGIIYPADQNEMNFDGKINVTIEKPREEITVTEIQKWGEQGNPDNANVINKAHKLDPNKIYWTVQIEGNQNSNIPGSKMTDQTLKHNWSYNHYYSETDMAAGLKFGVSICNHEGGDEEWHTWTVYPGEDLIWTENGWEFTMPETVICNKNPNSPHELVLGNEHYTYYIEYTSTPTHVDIAGQLEYANAVEIDNKRQEGWAGFTQSEVKTSIYKNNTIISDAGGAKIVWEVQATIPKKDPNQKRAEHDWVISDTVSILDKNWTGIYATDNDIRISSLTANYFGTTINVPHFSVATENDPYAYYSNFWSNGVNNGGSITILQRCACTKDNCGEWSEENNRCNPWVYEDGEVKLVTAFCDCWHETEDTTFTITYETDITEEIELYGGLGHFAYNYADIYNANNYLSVEKTVPIPGVIKKEDLQPDGALVKYNITVNEAKLNLTDGKQLVIHDEMTDSLTFMRGSLFIKSEDAAGNIIDLQENLDYTYAYKSVDENNKPILNDNGERIHVLEVTILHPQPVTYILDYNTMLIVQGATAPLTYNNTATISLWSGKASSSSAERVFPEITFASNAFSVFVHKLSSVGDGLPLADAEFGLFNEQGGLIAKATTNAEGKAYFETDVLNGIVLREHKIYYIKELTAPPGYKLDDTIHEFTFCSNSDGTCDVYNDLKEEHDLTRVPFDTVGHIDVINNPAHYDLPATGGTGTYLWILVSVILIIIPLVYIFIRRRKRERRGVG